ncbi:MAG: FAD-binding protein [Raoultibacter sp.]
MSTQKTVSRRTFLTGSVVVAAGASLGLFGYSQPSNEKAAQASEGSWDKECDILVVGTGTAAFAAIAAADFGAESVIVLEKSPSMFGGTSATSGGGLGIPLSDAAKEAGIEDSEEKVLTYYKAASNGRADEAVVKSYTKNGNEFLKWTSDTLGLKWGFTSPAFQDYYEPCEGFLPYGRGSISVLEIDGTKNQGAAGVWTLLQQTVKDNEKTELLMDTAATELVVDEEGRVVGVVASKGGKDEMRIHATKGVILGTGGFDHNDEMRKEFLPYPLFVTNAAPGNTGDAQRMGMTIGAAVSLMDSSWGVPCFLPAGKNVQEMIDANEIATDFVGNDWAMYRGKPGALVVNKAGRRFGDEAQVYAIFNRDFGQFSSSIAGFPNIPAFFICDSTYTAAYTLPGQKTKEDPIPEFVVKANTIEELAEKLGIDVAGLTAELEVFNAKAAEGLDPYFGRGTKQIDINTTGLYAGSRTDIPNPCLSPVATGPFYGAVYVPGTCGTNGGLKANENAQVVGLDGTPIAGLYAIGNCSSGVSGGAYCHGGMTVGAGAVMGWVAVRHALGVS